jgi:uncharacterized protein (TIGR03000 family)
LPVNRKKIQRAKNKGAIGGLEVVKLPDFNGKIGGFPPAANHPGMKLEFLSVVLMAATCMGTLAFDSQLPAPEPFTPLPAAEFIQPLPVPPWLYGSDAYPGERIIPGVPRKGVQTQTTFPGRAVLIILLPPDAELYFNGRYIKSASDRRSFLTCDLLPGHSYFFDLKVQVVRNYRPYRKLQRIIFRPGEVLEVSFGDVFSSGDLCVPFAPGWY